MRHGADTPPTPASRWISTFQRFLHAEATGGVLLLICAVLALAWANSPWAGAYTALWNTPVEVRFGGFYIDKPLLLWINDGLMAIFFFVVGLEIKRELLVGELSSPRQAALPLVAAVGGMVIPAGIFLALNFGRPTAQGWAIPMATDIAFALGVLALLGTRAPLSLKVFLTALAIVDDLGAVLVIALFYTESIKMAWLGLGAAVLVVLAVLNAAGTRKPLPYALLGLVLWVAFLKSGVHATIAGVLLALTIPARTRIDATEFASRADALVDVFRAVGPQGPNTLTSYEQRSAVESLEVACEEVQSPLQRLEHVLHPWVALFIMPVFALANAGVTLDAGALGAVTQPLTLGVALGLILGKLVGVTGGAWIAVRSGLAEMPAGVGLRQLLGVGFLAGIGFTMSLFIAGLAFGGSELLDQAKVGILGGSLIAGLAGAALLLSAPRSEPIVE